MKIKEFPNYNITRDGVVSNIKTGRVLKQCKNSGGYLVLNLYKKGLSENFGIHVLLGLSFIPNPENKPTVDHINRDKTDNRLCNLRWSTLSEQLENRRKYKESKLPKNNKLGEKYIIKTVCDTYRVGIRNIYLNINKTFKNLEDAIVYRDVCNTVQRLFRTVTSN